MYGNILGKDGLPGGKAKDFIWMRVPFLMVLY